MRILGLRKVIDHQVLDFECHSSTPFYVGRSIVDDAVPPDPLRAAPHRHQTAWEPEPLPETRV